MKCNKLLSISLMLSAALAGALAYAAVTPKASAQQVTETVPDLTYAAEKSVNSVVYIKVTQNSKTETYDYYDPFEDFFGDIFGRGNGNNGIQKRQYKTPQRKAAGSGVIISSDGYIVTNNHVVSDADEIDVKLNDNREFKARIIGTDKTTDLALVKIEGSDFPAITIGSSDNLKLGEWVLAVGNPFNLTSTVTAGIVSAKARSVGANGIESFIQTDAAINPGNSGGALVNTRGELVGINDMIISQTGSYAGYGFAIPTSIMNKVVDDLKKFGTVQRAIIGIRGSDVSNYIDAEKEKGNTVNLGTVNGVYIDSVEDNSSASEAGLQKGDVITAINGKKVEKMAELQEAVSVRKPGDKIQLTYMRDKKSYTKSITLKNAQGTTAVVKEVDIDEMGVSLTPLSDELKQQLGLSYGLEVTAIRNGDMQKAGISKGLIILQVNDKQMRTRNDFDEAVKSANMSDDRTLWIRAVTKSGIKKSFTVDLNKEEK
jgi:serine protease Do